MSQFVIMFGLSLSHYKRLNLFDHKEKTMNSLSINMYISKYICIYMYFYMCCNSDFFKLMRLKEVYFLKKDKQNK